MMCALDVMFSLRGEARRSDQPVATEEIHPITPERPRHDTYGTTRLDTCTIDHTAASHVE
jgi:hypothetical protein